MGFLDIFYDRYGEISKRKFKSPEGLKPAAVTNVESQAMFGAGTAYTIYNGRCLKCNSIACTDPTHSTKAVYSYYDLDYVYHNAPAVRSAVSDKVYYLLGSGLNLRTKNNEDDETNPSPELIAAREKFNSWLETENDLGMTNKKVIISAMAENEFYGHAGIEIVHRPNEQASIKFVPSSNFVIVTNGGIEKRTRDMILFYWVTLYGWTTEMKPEIADITKNFSRYPQGKFGEYYILPDKFIHLRKNADNLYGKSPFLFDRHRLQLVLDAGLSNIQDAKNDGYAKLVATTNELGYDQVSKFSGIKADVMKADPRKFAEAVNSLISNLRDGLSSDLNDSRKKDSITVANGAIVKEIKEVSRAVTSDQYLEYIRQEGPAWAAQQLGMHPSLLGVRDTSYATSIAPIILNYRNKIRPEQEDYELIFNKILPEIGLGDYEVEILPIKVENRREEADIYIREAQALQQMVSAGVPTEYAIPDFLRRNGIKFDPAKLPKEIFVNKQWSTLGGLKSAEKEAENSKKQSEKKPIDTKSPIGNNKPNK